MASEEERRSKILWDYSELATRLDMPIKCIFWKPVEMLLGNHAKESYHLVPADSGFSLQPPASPDPTRYCYYMIVLVLYVS